MRRTWTADCSPSPQKSPRMLYRFAVIHLRLASCYVYAMAAPILALLLLPSAVGHCRHNENGGAFRITPTTHHSSHHPPGVDSPFMRHSSIHLSIPAFISLPQFHKIHPRRSSRPPLVAASCCKPMARAIVMSIALTHNHQQAPHRGGITPLSHIQQGHHPLSVSHRERTRRQKGTVGRRFRLADGFTPQKSSFGRRVDLADGSTRQKGILSTVAPTASACFAWSASGVMVTGSELSGMSMTVVMPPRAAAVVPVAMPAQDGGVSHCLWINDSRSQSFWCGCISFMVFGSFGCVGYDLCQGPNLPGGHILLGQSHEGKLL